MFFELSDGTILNLNHIESIPTNISKCTLRTVITGYSDIPLTMDNGRTFHVISKDARRIRAILQSKIRDDAEKWIETQE